MVEKENKTTKEKYEIKEIATQTGLAIVDTETDEQYTLETALIKILNNQTKLMALLN